MGTTQEAQGVAHVTPLLSIADGGEENVERAISQIMYGTPVTVSSATKAAEVLRYFGCSPEWINARIDYAFTGEAPGLIG